MERFVTGGDRQEVLADDHVELVDRVLLCAAARGFGRKHVVECLLELLLAAEVLKADLNLDEPYHFGVLAARRGVEPGHQPVDELEVFERLLELHGAGVRGIVARLIPNLMRPCWSNAAPT